MGDLHQEIKTLKVRIKRLERFSTVGLILCGVAFLADKSSYIAYLVVALLVMQIYKSISRRRLKQKEYLAKEVEERTREIRSERDAVQEESQKLSAALDALAEAQDELVRQERMATIGQLTKGLVDRILNPLNYINNFATLSEGLTKELRKNLKEEEAHVSADRLADSMELLDLMERNLAKIAEHGYNTVRIVKAMEELLKERKGNQTLTNIHTVCRIALDKIRKIYEKEIAEKQVRLTFEGLSLPLMLEVNAEQISEVLVHLLKNAMYAVLKKAEKEAFEPEVICRLQLEGDRLLIRIRDNGTGLDDSLKKKIFAPFFTTKPTAEAAGIGLYVCCEMIQNHRGTIEVESEKGVFTEFRIYLPVYPAKNSASEKKELEDQEENE